MNYSQFRITILDTIINDFNSETKVIDLSGINYLRDISIKGNVYTLLYWDNYHFEQCNTKRCRING